MNQLSLARLAGSLWMMGGLILLWRGIPMILQAHADGASVIKLLGFLAIGLVVGAAKGKFVLSKSARRNLDRISRLPEPSAPWRAWPLYLYVLIPLMIALGLGIRHLAKTDQLPGSWATAGAIYLGIGAALIVSGLTYFKKKNLPS